MIFPFRCCEGDPFLAVLYCPGKWKLGGLGREVLLSSSIFRSRDVRQDGFWLTEIVGSWHKCYRRSAVTGGIQENLHANLKAVSS